METKNQKEVNKLNKFKVINISLLFIVSSLVLTFFHIFVFQVTDLPKIEFEENEKTVSDTLKYSIEENENEIVHTRFLGNDNLFYNVFNTYIVKTVTTYTLSNDDTVTSANVKYYYQKQHDANKDYKSKNEETLKTDFSSNIEISENVITQDLTNLFYGMNKNEIIASITSSYIAD